MKFQQVQLLGIREVATQHAQWAEALSMAAADEASIEVDVSQLGHVDAAGLQLLLSLRASVVGRGMRLRLHGACDGLRETLTGLRSSLVEQLV